MSFWKSLRGRASPADYDLPRLVDSRRITGGEPCAVGGWQLLCDIDKTYLETEFESVARLVRIAFESATAKVTVAGASDVLLAARWGDPAVSRPPLPLHFVSSSPPQMRAVLEEKLALDGLDWDSDTFKDQAYNLRMGRMDLLKQHVAYKSLAIVRLVASGGAGACFAMLGDNAESDAYIYVGVKLAVEGRLSRAGYGEWLQIAGVDDVAAARVAEALPETGRAKVGAILIRNVPGYALVREAPLTDAVLTFDDFFGAALLLVAAKVIPPSRIWPLARAFHNRHGLRAGDVAESLRTLARGRAEDPEIVRATSAALSRWGEAEVVAGAATLAESLGRDGARFEALTEAEILAHARTWQQNLALKRGRATPD
jgi:hypothetical protein